MKKRIKLIKKNFYFAIVVVVLLFIAGFVIAAYDASKASHGTLYTDVIEPRTGSNIGIIGANVGIGTTNPTETLDVGGNIKASGTICDSNGCIGSGGGLEQTTKSVNDDGPVCCDSGWTRSGCSGGESGDRSNEMAYPSSSNPLCCVGSRRVDVVYVHCIRIV